MRCELTLPKVFGLGTFAASAAMGYFEFKKFQIYGCAQVAINYIDKQDIISTYNEMIRNKTVTDEIIPQVKEAFRSYEELKGNLVTCANHETNYDSDTSISTLISSLPGLSHKYDLLSTVFLVVAVVSAGVTFGLACRDTIAQKIALNVPVIPQSSRQAARQVNRAAQKMQARMEAQAKEDEKKLNRINFLSKKQGVSLDSSSTYKDLSNSSSDEDSNGNQEPICRVNTVKVSSMRARMTEGINSPPSYSSSSSSLNNEENKEDSSSSLSLDASQNYQIKGGLDSPKQSQIFSLASPVDDIQLEQEAVSQRMIQESKEREEEYNQSLVKRKSRNAIRDSLLDG